MTIGLTVDYADQAKLLRFMVMFPRETYRGIGRAGATIRSKLRKLMRKGGGSDGVDKFKPHALYTQILHPQRKLGGKLAETTAIQMYKQGKAKMTIGFVSGLASWARPFQEKESRPFSDGERKYMHKFGLSAMSGYVRPARNLIEPFTVNYSHEFMKWAIRNTEKIIEKAAKR